MADLPTPEDLEIKAVRAGITMTEACRLAKVSPAVFFRWKSGDSSPTFSRITRVIDVLDAKIAAKGATR
jgi:predicted transcriptional regulator